MEHSSYATLSNSNFICIFYYATIARNSRLDTSTILLVAKDQKYLDNECEEYGTSSNGSSYA